MQPTLPAIIAGVLPLLGQILSSILTDDRQKPGINAAIAGAFVLIVAVLCAVLAGNFTGDAQLSLLAVVAYVALLMRGSFAQLGQFFEMVPSPVASALFGKPMPPATPLVKAAPTPIVFPPAAQPEPPTAGVQPAPQPPQQA